MLNCLCRARGSSEGAIRTAGGKSHEQTPDTARGMGDLDIRHVVRDAERGRTCRVSFEDLAIHGCSSGADTSDGVADLGQWGGRNDGVEGELGVRSRVAALGVDLQTLRERRFGTGANDGLHGLLVLIDGILNNRNVSRVSGVRSLVALLSSTRNQLNVT